MSLFNETVARAARAEKALDDCQQRCANLEIALKACMKRKLSEGPYYGRQDRPEVERPGVKVSGRHNELNNLSSDDVDKLFERHHRADVERGLRARLAAPLEKLAALLRR